MYIFLFISTDNLSQNFSDLFHHLLGILRQYTKEGLVMMYITRPVLFIFSDEAMKVRTINRKINK